MLLGGLREGNAQQAGALPSPVPRTGHLAGGQQAALVLQECEKGEMRAGILSERSVALGLQTYPAVGL